MIKITDKTKYIIIAILIMIIGIGFYKHLKSNKEPVFPLKKTQVHATDTTSVSISPNTTDTNLYAKSTYVANINGKRVEVAPKVDTSKTTLKDTTVTVVQEIDVTPLVKAATPNWEVGVGVGVHNNDYYIPVSVQRNYKYNKGINVQLHVKPKDNFKVCGGSVMHVWKF